MEIKGATIILSVMLEIENDYGIRWALEAPDEQVEQIIEGIFNRVQIELGEPVLLDDGEGHIIAGPNELAKWLWKKLKEWWKKNT